MSKSQKNSDKSFYKSIFFVIFLTIMMILTCIILSYSISHLVSKGKNMNYNSLIAPVKVITGGEYDDDHKEDIVFNYEEKNTIGNGIKIDYMSPTSYEVGMRFQGDYYTFEFNVYFGDKSLNRYYEITASKLPTSTLDDKYVKLYLESDSKGLPSVFDENNRVKVFSLYENATINKENNNEKILYSGYISKSDLAMGHKTFIFKMWASYEMPINESTENKNFSVLINVYAK